MAENNLSAPHFHDADKAREYLETTRWPDGPVCPHCGNTEKVYQLQGEKTRAGVYKCAACRKQFTVTVNTLFQGSHVPLNKWLMAVYLLCSSKKGISSHQLHRMLGVTYKTAWFMTHRIREAMKDTEKGTFGGDGNTVEVDETFIGNAKQKHPKSRGYEHKHKILSLVERGGRSRSMVVDNLKAKTLLPIIQEQVAADSRIMTDEATQYQNLNNLFTDHQIVRHSVGEYVRGEAYTNTIEGFFNIFKRGMKGIYQHCGKRHLPRYLAEFDFRYSNRGVDDAERAMIALKGIGGKRLLYT